MAKTFYINYYDDIQPGKIKALMMGIGQMLNPIRMMNMPPPPEKPDELYFAFSSPGGDVDAGITLYNFLKGLPCNITMHNIGSIASIANVVFMAGKKRYASHGTSFHYHGVAGGMRKDQSVTVAHLQEMLSGFQQSENRIAKILISECGLTTEEIEARFRQGKSEDVDFALSKGIIHEIRDFRIPDGEQFVSLNLPG